MAHRRQYIPGSQVKTSRTRLALQNERLKKEVEHRDDILRAVAEVNRERERERIAKENSGIRGFINKVKRAFTTPLFGRRVGAK